MAKVKGDIVVDIERCKGCELCVVACPQDTIALSDKINKKGDALRVTLFTHEHDSEKTIVQDVKIAHLSVLMR